MKFVDDGPAVVSPEQEWTARVSPFLLASDPHQACVLRARNEGLEHVNSVCACEHAGCSQLCCNPDTGDL